MTDEAYRFRSGEVYGEPDRTPAKDFAAQPPPLGLADRARLAKRRRKVDPTWADKSRESRRLLLEQDRKDERR